MLNLEAATFSVAVVATMVRPVQRKVRGHKFFLKQPEIIAECLIGAAIVPFGLIIASVFSPDLMQKAEGEKVLLAIGGFMGLVYVVGDLLKKPDPPAQ